MTEVTFTTLSAVSKCFAFFSSGQPDTTLDSALQHQWVWTIGSLEGTFIRRRERWSA